MSRIPEELESPFDELVAGPAKVRDAVRDLDAPSLNARPPGEEWSIRDAVLHLCDAELIAAASFRIMLGAEDDVAIPDYDQDLWTRRLHYLFRDVEAALVTFHVVRFGNAELLQQLGRDTWQKSATHPEAGRLTVAELLHANVAHTAEHVEQIGTFRALIE